MDRSECITASGLLNGLVNLNLVSYSGFPGVISATMVSVPTSSANANFDGQLGLDRQDSDRYASYVFPIMEGLLDRSAQTSRDCDPRTWNRVDSIETCHQFWIRALWPSAVHLLHTMREILAPNGTDDGDDFLSLSSEGHWTTSGLFASPNAFPTYRFEWA